MLEQIVWLLEGLSYNKYTQQDTGRVGVIVRLSIARAVATSQDISPFQMERRV